jgi:hypothetical protein
MGCMSQIRKKVKRVKSDTCRPHIFANHVFVLLMFLIVQDSFSVLSLDDDRDFSMSDVHFCACWTESHSFVWFFYFALHQ